MQLVACLPPGARVRLVPNCTPASDLGIRAADAEVIVPGARGTVCVNSRYASDVQVHFDGAKYPWWVYKSDVVPDIGEGDDLTPLSEET